MDTLINHTAKQLHQARFMISAPSLSQCPADQGHEIAFAGRSNAGKSSAINTLTGQSKLAKTSKTPGRTQLINFFDLGAERRLVDLPGYGYAKVPVKMKQAWQQAMGHYLENRQSLRGVILLMDIRHPLTSFDQQMLEWASHHQMPVHVLLTKADKLKHGAAKSTLLSTRKQLKSLGDSFSVQLFSSLKRSGLEECLEKMGQWLALDTDEGKDGEQ